jgi:GAF domain-containing protein
MQGKRNATFRYALYGALFGLFFPVFATLIDLFIQQLPLTLENALRVQISSPLHWVIDTAPLFLGLFASFAGRRQDQLTLANEQLGRQVERLETLQETLEQRVEQRTADLARRNTQLATAAQVVRDAVEIQDIQRLLDETVRLISDRFGFYHTGIFMLDEAGEYVVLRAASSEGGRRMLARGHRLRFGQVGIVGYVAERGEPRIALDVGEDTMFFVNPDLPETRSEIALPLQARGEMIGALDVQSDEPQAFGEEEVAVLQTLADQVAIAISNARLFEKAQESLEAERRAYGELSREAWRELLRARAGLSQRYDPHNILPADGRWREEMKQAVRQKETVTGTGTSTMALAAPITVRGQVIGVLDAHKPEYGGEWTAEEMVLLETLVDQLGVALDSARLYEEAQHRALQEQVLGEISTRMRETLDMDSVLRTAAQEVRQVLELPEVVIRLVDRPGGDGQHGVEQD